MDDIEVLEAMEQGERLGSSTPGSSRKRGRGRSRSGLFGLLDAKSERSPSPQGTTKRRISAGGTGSASGVKSEQPFKADHGGEEDPNKELGLAVAPGDPFEDPGDKDCNGCGRNAIIGQCWYRGGVVTWALPKARGSWCKDCYGCWRLMLSTHTTLIGLVVWLRSPKNFSEWEVLLASYVSLRREGSERITEVMVLQRRATIEFVVKLMGLQLTKGTLVRLTDMHPAKMVDASKLVDMGAVVVPDSPIQRCLGYWCDDMPASSSTSVAKPGVQHCMFSWRATLHTEVAEDRDIIKTQWPEVDAGQGVASSQLAVPSPANQPKTAAKSLVDWVRSQLAPYATSTWESVKESAYTSIFAKIAALQTELAAGGDDAQVSVLNKWSNALAQAKVFTKKYRLYIKSKKPHLLHTLHPYLDEWVSFMLDEGIVVHNDLLLLRLKVRFVCGGADETWSESMAVLVTMGFFDVLAAIPADVSLTPDGWARACLLMRFSMDFENMDVTDVEVQRVVCEKSTTEIIAVFEASPLRQTLCKVIEDLDAVQTMCRAGLEQFTVTAAQATKAAALLADARFTLMRGALDRSAVGQEMYAPLKELLRRSAEDDVADQRLRSATDVVEDSNMPKLCLDRLVAGPAFIEVRNAHMVMEGDTVVYNAIKDCAHFLAEAINMWSPVRIHEQQQLIKGVLTKIEEMQLAVDLTLGWMLHDMTRDFRAAIRNMLPDIAIDTKDFATIVLKHSTVDHDAKETAKLLTSGSDFLASQARVFQVMDRTVSLLGELEGFAGVASCAAAGAANSTMLHEMLRVAQTTLQVMSSKIMACPRAAFLEWVEHKDTSKVQQALDWIDMVDKIRSDTCFKLDVASVDLPADVSIQLGTEEAPIGEPVPLQALRFLPQEMKSQASVDYVRGLLQNVAAHALVSFVEILELAGIRKVAVQSKSGESFTAVQLIDHFLVASDMPKTQLDATKAFRNNAEDPEFVSVAALALMRTLLTNTGTKFIDVSVGLVHEPAINIGVDEVMSMCQIITFVHSVCCALLFLRNELKSVTCALVDHMLRDDIRNAIAYGLDQCDCGLSDIDSNECMLQGAEALQVPWVWGVACVKGWLTRARSAMIDLRCQIFAVLVADMHEYSKVVEKHTPKYDHFCNAKSFAPSLARKNLLGHPFRTSLGQECQKLFYIEAQLGEVETAFDLSDTKNDPKFRDAYEHARLTFEGAKRALVVIAAARIVLEYTGEEQKTQAKKMVDDRAADLPKSLLNSLKEKMVAPDASKSQPSKASATATRAEKR